MKEKITITIDEEVLKEFRKVCKEEGFKMSTKIERLIENFIKSQR